MVGINYNAAVDINLVGYLILVGVHHRHQSLMCISVRTLGAAPVSICVNLTHHSISETRGGPEGGGSQEEGQEEEAEGKEAASTQVSRAALLVVLSRVLVGAVGSAGVLVGAVSSAVQSACRGHVVKFETVGLCFLVLNAMPEFLLKAVDILINSS